MTRGPQLESSLRADKRRRRVEPSREVRFRLNHVELGRGIERALQFERPSAEQVGQPEQHAPDFGGFLLFERHDLVIDFDRTERFDEQRRAARRHPMDNARDGVAMLGFEHQHGAAVPLSDDELLQVAGRLAGPQVRLEHRAQAPTLFAEPFAHRPQLRAGLVVELPARTDRAAHGGNLGVKGCARLGQTPQQRKRGSRAEDRRPRVRDRGQKLRKPQKLPRFEGTALDGEGGQDRVEIGRRAQGERTVSIEKPHAFGRGGEERRDAPGIGRGRERPEPRAPEGRRRERRQRIEKSIELEGPQGAFEHGGRKRPLHPTTASDRPRAPAGKHPASFFAISARAARLSSRQGHLWGRGGSGCGLD